MSDCFVSGKDYAEHWQGKTAAPAPKAEPIAYAGPERRQGGERRVTTFADRRSPRDRERDRRWRARDRRRTVLALVLLALLVPSIASAQSARFQIEHDTFAFLDWLPLRFWLLEEGTPDPVLIKATCQGQPDIHLPGYPEFEGWINSNQWICSYEVPPNARAWRLQAENFRRDPARFTYEERFSEWSELFTLDDDNAEHVPPFAPLRNLKIQPVF